MDKAKILKACEEIARKVQGSYNEGRPMQLCDTVKVRTMCDVIEREVQEAEPVRHGRWIDKSPLDWCLNYRCSVCGQDDDDSTPYCPHCGAKMGGGAENG